MGLAITEASDVIYDDRPLFKQRRSVDSHPHAMRPDGQALDIVSTVKSVRIGLYYYQKLCIDLQAFPCLGNHWGFWNILSEENRYRLCQSAFLGPPLVPTG